MHKMPLRSCKSGVVNFMSFSLHILNWSAERGWFLPPSGTDISFLRLFTVFRAFSNASVYCHMASSTLLTSWSLNSRDGLGFPWPRPPCGIPSSQPLLPDTFPVSAVLLAIRFYPAFPHHSLCQAFLVDVSFSTYSYCRILQGSVPALFTVRSSNLLIDSPARGPQTWPPALNFQSLLIWLWVPICQEELDFSLTDASRSTSR